MASVSRFECASCSVELKALLLRTRRGVSIWFAVGLAAHLSLTQLAGSHDEQKAAKPLTTQFVKREPRLTKPLELKKRPQPKRRPIERTMVSVKARTERRSERAVFEATQFIQGLVRPRSAIGRDSKLASSEFEPLSVAQALESTKETEQKIDTSLELLDIEALDTGQYNAMIVQDPDDKRSIKGFCRLSVIYSTQFFSTASTGIYGYEMMVDIGFHRLVTVMNEWTDIRTEALGRMMLNDEALLKAPWVLFGPTRTFQLIGSQKRSLGEYMLAGGFVFGDRQNLPRLAAGWAATFRCIRIALIESLAECGVVASIEKLASSHPIYYCYFDLGGPIGGCDTAHAHEHRDQARPIGFCEGIEVGGRLLAFVSGKGYTEAWSAFGPSPGRAPQYDPVPSFRMGVNSVIFALTQEGSITHQLMESLR